MTDRTTDDIARVLVGAARAGLMYGYPTDTERIQEIDVVSVLSHMPDPPEYTAPTEPENPYEETTEWSIRDTETGDVLISIGGNAATQERFEALVDGQSGRYEMVYRTVLRSRWQRME